MLLSLAYFLQWGPVGLSLEESSQMMALGESLISGFSVNNSFLVSPTWVSQKSFLIRKAHQLNLVTGTQ